MTERDPIEDAALEVQEDFNALITEYDDREVVVRAVTGILATTAYAASNSPGEARELVNAIAAEAKTDYRRHVRVTKGQQTGSTGLNLP